MTSLALGIVSDLREKRLLPVAVLLVVALAAVPFVLRKPANETPAPVVASAAGPQSADGLPTPEAVLSGGGRPLVTPALLRRSSDLERFESKNPFKPLEQLGGQGDNPTAPADGDGSGSTGAGGPAGGADDGGGGSGDGTLPSLGDVPDFSAPPAGDGGPTEQRLAYVVDVTFDGPSSPERHYRNLARLSMLPSAENPLLVFLGVGASGNDAVFLVDSTLRPAEGEGRCSPSPEECATVSLEPGEEQYFVDEQDRRYYVTLDQIRERPLAAASSQGEADAGADQATGSRTARRFLPPRLIDVLVRTDR